ncbi:MAG: hypothetical protein EPN86_00540 [Nanoarchaeota archaeon]|nr:MAG: hypothetical protein EPN86_00540 [Nanoarchaeota archaeon]
MEELPNAISYVIFVAILVAVGSVAVAWGPLHKITSFAIADQHSCTKAECDAFDVYFCDSRALKQANYECIDGGCRLVSKHTVLICNYNCVEPEDSAAHCQIANPN